MASRSVMHILQHSPHNNALSMESLEELTKGLTELHLLVKAQPRATPLRGPSRSHGTEYFSYGKTEHLAQECLPRGLTYQVGRRSWAVPPTWAHLQPLGNPRN